jgi:hypothetical protein
VDLPTLGRPTMPHFNAMMFEPLKVVYGCAARSQLCFD